MIFKERRSLSNGVRKITQMFPRFTDPDFLTAYPVFANLYSSEPLKIQSEKHEAMLTLLGKETLSRNELHEFVYFHQRDKKAVLYQLIAIYLLCGGKSQLLILENGDFIDREQLKSFLNKVKAGQNFEQRVIFLESCDGKVFKFNMMCLPILLAKREFIKCLILCDVNSFESKEKGSLEKIYQNIPSELAVISFRRQFADYKFLNRKPQGTGSYEINDKAVHALGRKYEQFETFISYVVPVECVEYSAKTIQETLSTVLVRNDPTPGKYIEIIFNGFPFKIESIRQV